MKMSRKKDAKLEKELAALNKKFKGASLDEFRDGIAKEAAKKKPKRKAKRSK